MKQDLIAMIDVGCKQLVKVARTIRRLGVYSEIYPHDSTAEFIKSRPNLRGIIVCGGDNRVVDGVSIDVNPAIYDIGVPVLTVEHKGSHANDVDAWPLEPTLILENFIDRCGADRNWNMGEFVEAQIEEIRAQVKDGRVLLALSGGVDSSVVAAILYRAIGDRLTCVHVNHGLLRKGESERVIEVFEREMGANLIYVDASERFLAALEGVEDPERKRKIIGELFIRVFEEEAKKLQGDIDFLAQGTIYPDILESGTKTEKAVKAHHNVGGLPQDVHFKLVEPLKYLFKDEVRQCGEQLGLPADMIYRQPFPGPGLGVRCLGAITRERLEITRESDAVLRDEFKKHGLDKKVWQYFTVVPDFKSVGVKNSQRTFEYPVIIRAVNTVDAMTATVEPLMFPVLAAITARILDEVPGCNRVLYDLTPKPTGTIEWE
ncbi:MAG: glutamine-hydrolyzing GMP synthase [Clostridia bacterium]|nr:glutamine-hydrolyzing GMP synthase [Clostridia bacterium]